MKRERPRDSPSVQAESLASRLFLGLGCASHRMPLERRLACPWRAARLGDVLAPAAAARQSATGLANREARGRCARPALAPPPPPPLWEPNPPHIVW